MPGPEERKNDGFAEAAEARRERQAREVAAWDAALAAAREAVRATTPPTPVPGPGGASTEAGADGRSSGE
jgi:hypothetical protein